MTAEVNAYGACRRFDSLSLTFFSAAGVIVWFYP
jgi:hypothetical protein